ncbi:hypothetical protein [Sporomusa aerivorans]
MIIYFDEQRFINEVKNMVRPFGLNKGQTEQVVKHALLAVRRSSKPAKS